LSRICTAKARFNSRGSGLDLIKEVNFSSMSLIVVNI
jgi:hypothetical protein